MLTKPSSRGPGEPSARAPGEPSRAVHSTSPLRRQQVRTLQVNLVREKTPDPYGGLFLTMVSMGQTSIQLSQRDPNQGFFHHLGWNSQGSLTQHLQFTILGQASLFQISDFRFHISDFRFLIPDFRFQISDLWRPRPCFAASQVSDFRFQISDFRFQISDFRFQISGFIFQISDS